MSFLVMDGVRRRHEGGSTIRLRPATEASVAEAVLTLPNDWLGGTNVLDGLRRASSSPVNIETESASSLPGRRISPWAVASLATIPMLAAASVIGARTYLRDRDAHAEATVSRAAAQSQAQPVSPNDQTAIAPAINSSLQQTLDNFGLSGTYSLYVKDLKSGQLAVVGPDRTFESASLYKLFVADAIYQKIDVGQLHYTDQAGGGTGNTISGCLNLMITISDNGCGQALGGLLNWNTLTQQMRGQGYSATNLAGAITYTTPRDVATLFQRLYAGTLVSPDSTNQFMSLLKAQKVNNRLPQGLPAGTTIAHKTGDLDGYMHDAGIVFGPKTDYLVVMMGAPGANPGDFASVSQKLNSFFNQ